MNTECPFLNAAFKEANQDLRKMRTAQTTFAICAKAGCGMRANIEPIHPDKRRVDLLYRYNGFEDKLLYLAHWFVRRFDEWVTKPIGVSEPDCKVDWRKHQLPTGNVINNRTS